ncbi:MAG: UTP--glucose-1-phosphate uridylyltransferase [Lentisphaerae bacterium]|nr:UTP--glucose-1-phosphate uridylyltransferase [Lentisphaerota bacterium]
MTQKTYPAVRKAVIPAAGFGTRFLPFTRAVPKEMIPLVDKPVIQYVIEEAAAAGIEDILIITSSGKEAMRDHFLPEPELEARLQATKKTALLENLKAIQNLARLSYVEQKVLNGLGGALMLAEEFAAGEPFAVLLGDTVVESSTTVPAVGQLIARYNQFGGTVVALEQVPVERVSNYGVIGGTQVADRLMQIEELVEKPAPEEAPSNLAIASRYVLTSGIFDCLKKSPAHGAGQEIYLTDALMMLGKSENVYGCEVEAHRYDIGNKLEFLKATVEFGLRHADGGEKFREYLKQKLSEIN